MYITVKMHDAVMERPQQSGEYYCITSSGCHFILPYSKDKDRFNWRDEWEDDGRVRAIRVNWWSELLRPERGGELL